MKRAAAGGVTGVREGIVDQRWTLAVPVIGALLMGCGGGDADAEPSAGGAGTGPIAGAGGSSGAGAGAGAAAGAGAGGSGAGGIGAMGDGDGCPFDLMKAVPGQCGCNRPDDDSDGDGSADCVDDCDDDPNKTERGTCDCGTPDTDSDGDGAADCADDAPDDPSLQEAGSCGTPDQPAAAGTPCDDGPCTGATECDGAGHCGDLSCAPPGCGNAEFRQLKGYHYWFCSGPVTWDQALEACFALSNRTLLQVHYVETQQLVEQVITTDVFFGANDRTMEDEWRWMGREPGDDDKVFWTGAADGMPYFGAYARWSSGNPGGGTAENCGVIRAETGEWDDVPCDDPHGFVCWVEGG